MIRDVFGDGERELASVDSFDSIGQASPRHRHSWAVVGATSMTSK